MNLFLIYQNTAGYLSMSLKFKKLITKSIKQKT